MSSRCITTYSRKVGSLTAPPRDERASQSFWQRPVVVRRSRCRCCRHAALQTLGRSCISASGKLRVGNRRPVGDNCGHRVTGLGARSIAVVHAGATQVRVVANWSLHNARRFSRCVDCISGDVYSRRFRNRNRFVDVHASRCDRRCSHVLVRRCNSELFPPQRASHMNGRSFFTTNLFGAVGLASAKFTGNARCYKGLSSRTNVRDLPRGA
jgi:hypothetical protein